MTITDLKSALEYSQRKLGSLALKDSFNMEGKTGGADIRIENNTDGEMEKWSLICQELQAQLEEAIISEFHPENL